MFILLLYFRKYQELVGCMRVGACMCLCEQVNIVDRTMKTVKFILIL